MEQGIEIIGQMDNTTDHTFESANRVYGVRGIAPTIPTCGGGGIQPKILEIGYLEKGTGKHQSNIVFDSDGLCPAICAGMAVKQQPTMHLEIVAIDDSYHSRDERIYKETSPTLRAENNFIKIAEIVAIDEQNDCVRHETFGTLTTDGSSPKHNNRVCEICDMRGRDKTNPNYIGTSNENFEQMLEINENGVCNTITTVQKDNLVLDIDKPNETEKSLRAEQSRAEQSSLIYVKQATKEGLIPMEIGGVADLNYPSSQTRRGRVIENGNVCPTLTTESVPNVLEDWTWEVNGERYLIRIRKLTPRECWRLMSFSDEDFDKAQSVNTNTQLYKQAGNSIVEEVLCAIFREMI